MTNKDSIETKIATAVRYRSFVVESNHIEGLDRNPTFEELQEHARFMELSEVTLDDIVRFVGVYQPDAKLRTKAGLNVTIGNHMPPAGGPGVGYALEELIARVNSSKDAFTIHVEYESLHPFTDGNGRSGRAIWAWMMERHHGGYPLGFLHHFYYQSLDSNRLHTR